MKEPKPYNNFEKIKLEFIKFKQEFGQSKNLGNINEDFLTREDLKLFELFLDFATNYEEHKKIIEPKILIKGILDNITTREQEIKKEKRSENEKKSSNYLTGFIRGQMTPITLDL